MFQRFHEVREREGGFTLIELLVVILIVAILAAVAIPVFLRQREKGYVDQMESALKNAATAEESYATGNNGSYTTAEADLVTEGFNPTVDVNLAFDTYTDAEGGENFCIAASHDRSDDARWYDGAVGAPTDTNGGNASCPATPAKTP